MHVTEDHRYRALHLIQGCERSLGRMLSPGQCVDLIADNCNDWPLAFIRRVLATLTPRYGAWEH